jgi:hypothetical protein
MIGRSAAGGSVRMARTLASDGGSRWTRASLTAHSGEGDQPFRLKVITDTGDRDHAITGL